MGLVLLLMFTFTDLQISLVIAKKPAWARMRFREMTDPVSQFTFSSDVTAGVLLSLAIFEVLRAVLCRLPKTRD